MKIDRLIAASVLVAVVALSGFAQTKPATQPAPQPSPPQTTGTVPDSKIAWIYSEAFQDPKTGIARVNALANALNREFQPRQTELTQLQQKAQQLNDDIEKTRSVADPKTLQQKVDQLEQLKLDAKRKSEDAQAALEKRQQEMFAPLEEDISKALQAFAKAHGISVIIDRSRVPLVYAADSIDVTRAFINEFNSKFPATASVATPK
jgi:Skp family chaperone for outer membrane proteins